MPQMSNLDWFFLSIYFIILFNLSLMLMNFLMYGINLILMNFYFKLNVNMMMYTLVWN